MMIKILSILWAAVSESRLSLSSKEEAHKNGRLLTYLPICNMVSAEALDVEKACIAYLSVWRCAREGIKLDQVGDIISDLLWQPKTIMVIVDISSASDQLYVSCVLLLPWSEIFRSEFHARSFNEPQEVQGSQLKTQIVDMDVSNFVEP
ncbi:uncharacterized protein PHALS_01383 [Plasmopara halstedii]|uniref:RxLR-like protein n=1 Tax=Plasmopara halstedii TaxID=4781 RepID=A0A0P1AUG6_PLAHL|nr:uncharacterized protein PHALS_01383 [Plasmopara halstedii]CEG45056.1 hypothetical protein PHALS_01383 [Plasmopara halstedii]|eukprot:XP_024581425.1 hypothetical protein PHALS_01383 [Plasmopara halstedii]